MHVIVVGCGRVGTELAPNLERLGHDVTMVDKNPRAFGRLADFGGRTVAGFGFDHETLREAGIEQAGALAAVTSGDNSNIVIARVAREHFGLERVVARIQDPARAEIYERLGIMTVATVTWANDQFIRRLLPGTKRADWFDSTGSVSLVERELPEAWAGKPLGDLARPGAIAVAAVSRQGTAEVVRPDTIGQAGDRIHVMVAATAVAALDEMLGDGEGAMKVMIAGAGVLGQHLAAALSAEHTVVLVEQDEDVIERLPASVREHVQVVRADACEVRALNRLGIEDVDAVVAATGDDEDNLVISLLAKQEFAVPRVLARVNNPKNEALFNETWGVDTVLSVPQMIGALVEEELTRGRVVRLLQLRDQARLVEVTLTEGAPLVGHTIAGLALPRQFTFVAVIRGGVVVIPRGDTEFRVGDEVLTLVTPDSEDDARRLLTGE